LNALLMALVEEVARNPSPIWIIWSVAFCIFFLWFVLLLWIFFDDVELVGFVFGSGNVVDLGIREEGVGPLESMLFCELVK